jgi:hypothetical protein
MWSHHRFGHMFKHEFPDSIRSFSLSLSLSLAISFPLCVMNENNKNIKSSLPNNDNISNQSITALMSCVWLIDFVLLNASTHAITFNCYDCITWCLVLVTLSNICKQRWKWVAWFELKKLDYTGSVDTRDTILHRCVCVCVCVCMSEREVTWLNNRINWALIERDIFLFAVEVCVDYAGVKTFQKLVWCEPVYWNLMNPGPRPRPSPSVMPPHITIPLLLWITQQQSSNLGLCEQWIWERPLERMLIPCAGQVSRGPHLSSPESGVLDRWGRPGTHLGSSLWLNVSLTFKITQVGQCVQWSPPDHFIIWDCIVSYCPLVHVM